MKKILFITLLLAQGSFAQNTISLDSCVVWAKRHYPLIRQNEVTQQLSQTNINSLNENWLPKLSFGAQGIYQSEVVQFSIPGFDKPFPHDQYAANLSLEQTVFDGGQTKSQKKIETISAELKKQSTEIELYKLSDRVNQLYSSILLARENLKVLAIYKENIENRKKDMSAKKDNGLVLESAIDELDAEILTTDQAIQEAADNLNASYKSLQFFIDKPINESTQLDITPIGGATKFTQISRPELKLFQLQDELLSAQNELTNRYSLPKLTFGLSGTYGRPGPNFINQNFRFFGNASVNIRWNVSSLYGLNREKKRFEYRTVEQEIQKNIFLFNLENTLTTQEAQINTLNSTLEKDAEIISKRHNVTLTAANQLENGKLNVTDYLKQLNAELSAQLNQKMHEIKLMNAISNYNITKGNPNF